MPEIRGPDHSRAFCFVRSATLLKVHPVAAERCRSIMPGQIRRPFCLPFDCHVLCWLRIMGESAILIYADVGPGTVHI